MQHVREPVGQVVEDLAGCALEPTFDREHAVEEIAQQPQLNAGGGAEQQRGAPVVP